MAAQGRGSATSALLADVVLLCLLLGVTGTTTAVMKQSPPPTKYVVGNDAGWTRGLEWWLDGKTFYAGDVLVFKYDNNRHDVAVVGAKGYGRCKPGHSNSSWVLSTGNDEVQLRRGNNYFICSKPGHCANNMKLHVKAW